MNIRNMEPQSKKPFTLHVVRSSGSINPSTIVEASMARKHTNNKNIQLEEAVEWCKEKQLQRKFSIENGYVPTG